MRYEHKEISLSEHAASCSSGLRLCLNPLDQTPLVILSVAKDLKKVVMLALAVWRMVLTVH
jgi:hypothetical protein